MVTICTAQWSLYVPHSGHYMYHTAVTICTAQWSLFVPHSGRYMYRTAVTICTPQWSLFVPHSGHYLCCTAVTICTASLTFNNSTFCPHTVFMCFVFISEQTAIISYTALTDWFLSAFAKLRKATIISVMSVRPHTTRLQMKEYSWNLIFDHFLKIYWENSRFTKIWQEWRYFTWWSIHISHDDQYIFHMMINTYFTWWSIHISHGVQ